MPLPRREISQIRSHPGKSVESYRFAVGAGFYPARAVGTIGFTIPFGEIVIALREG